MFPRDGGSQRPAVQIGLLEWRSSGVPDGREGDEEPSVERQEPASLVAGPGGDVHDLSRRVLDGWEGLGRRGGRAVEVLVLDDQRLRAAVHGVLPRAPVIAGVDLPCLNRPEAVGHAGAELERQRVPEGSAIVTEVSRGRGAGTLNRRLVREERAGQQAQPGGAQQRAHLQPRGDVPLRSGGGDEVVDAAAPAQGGEEVAHLAERGRLPREGLLVGVGGIGEARRDAETHRG